MSFKLSLVTILVENMPACKAFYTELLGYEIVREFSSPTDDFLLLRRQGGTTIALQKMQAQPYGLAQGHGGVALGFLVDDADAVYRAWKEKSVAIEGEVIDIGAGRMFMLKDPDGNAVQVYHLYPPVLEAQKQMNIL